jgi:hypothetical protein
MGTLTATGGMLLIERGRNRVLLKPERDGVSHIFDVEMIESMIGTPLKVPVGEQRFEDRDAVRRSADGAAPPARGRPGPAISPDSRT